MKKIIDIWFNDISKFNNENIIIGLAIINVIYMVKKQ